MELFKYLPIPEPTSFEQGQKINGIKSVMWAERYRDAGEFEIVSPLSAGLMDFLPLGSLIAQVDSFDIMIVENHEIKEDSNGDADIKITGRSFETYLENRIVGMNQIKTQPQIVEYPIAAVATWDQLTSLIFDHIQNGTFPDGNLPNVYPYSICTGAATYEFRTFKRMPLYQAVLEILAVDDLGIKTIRRNPFIGASEGGHPVNTNYVIHRGQDKTASVIFSWKAGDLSAAEYLWSDKPTKNSVAVIGRYINTYYDTPGVTNYNRRSMVISADDIDGVYSSPPTGQALVDVINRMVVRGKQALDSQNRLTLTRADVSNLSRYQYRKDFNIGDLVSLDANFGQIAKMRIIEYVEIMDENGETGHPTLSVPGV